MGFWKNIGNAQKNKVALDKANHTVKVEKGLLIGAVGALAASMYTTRKYKKKFLEAGDDVTTKTDCLGEKIDEAKKKMEETKKKIDNKVNQIKNKGKTEIDETQADFTEVAETVEDAAEETTDVVVDVVDEIVKEFNEA